MLVATVAIFYFFAIRPQKKQERETTAMRNSICVGDEIITIGGITGTVCAVKETSVVIETGADRVRIELAKWGVSNKLTADEKAKFEASVAAVKKTNEVLFEIGALTK